MEKNRLLYPRLRTRLLFAAKLLILLLLLGVQFEYHWVLESLNLGENYLKGLWLFVTAHLVIDFLQITLISIYNRRRKLPPGKKSNFSLGIKQIAFMGTVIAGMIAALLMLNISIRDALTSISIVAAAIAILSKDYVSNMINGLILMFSEQLALKDHVKIGDQQGRIIDITLLNLHLVNDEDELVYIPNSVVLSEQIVNYTKQPTQTLNVPFELDYADCESLGALERYLQQEVGAGFPQVMPMESRLRVSGVEKDRLKLVFQYVLSREMVPRDEDGIKALAMHKLAVYIQRLRKRRYEETLEHQAPQSS